MDKQRPPNFTLSHCELYVRDRRTMLDFYTRVLGFVVTDQAQDADGLVFLSRSPDEHHQIVFNPSNRPVDQEPVLDHLAFRVGSLPELRYVHRALLDAEVQHETVSHGTTWSIYFQDPETNRLEVFTDTPWYVHQPLRFEIDLSMTDFELFDWTEKKLRKLPGFKSLWDWQVDHHSKVKDSNQ